MASGSPRRKKLLEKLKVPFAVHPSLISETFDVTKKPEKIAQNLAFDKAEDVFKKYPGAVVIGADTIVAFNGKVIGKPKSKEEATKILEKLSNNIHQVITGVALIKTDECSDTLSKKLFFESTTVAFAELTSSMIKSYVATGSPMDKAGAYGIQDDWGAVFTKRIEGDFYNVMGLPLHSLFHELQSFAPHVLHL